jgi:leader peptidase (prepilin peptidase)/N-methyltransferase
MWIAAAVAGLFGMLIGSFLNACIYRLPRDISLWNPSRSFCPSCEKQIAWYDNLPAISYLMLRAKCRRCGARIPIRYFLVEILCGIMYFVIVASFGLSWLSAKLMVFAAINLELIFSDFEERILPDEFTKGGVVLGLLFAWVVFLPPGFASLFIPVGTGPEWYSVAESALGAGFGYGSLWAISAGYKKIRGREGMGQGDLKMVAMMGAFLGLAPMLLVLMAGSVFGSVAGLTYIKIAKEKAETYELPFGSFLGMAALGVAWLEAARSIAGAVVH